MQEYTHCFCLICDEFNACKLIALKISLRVLYVMLQAFIHCDIGKILTYFEYTDISNYTCITQEIFSLSCGLLVIDLFKIHIQLKVFMNTNKLFVTLNHYLN